MTDTILKAGCVVLLLAVVFLSGVCWVNLRTIDDLTARNEELNGSLLAIDLKARAETEIYERNLNAIKDKSNRDRAAVDAYYRGLLSKTKDHPGTRDTAENSAGMDSGCSQQTISGCSIEIEQRCIKDAMRVQDIAEFFRLNQYPTE